MTMQSPFLPAAAAASRNPSRTAPAARANAGSSSGSTSAITLLVGGAGSRSGADAGATGPRGAGTASGIPASGDAAGAPGAGGGAYSPGAGASTGGATITGAGTTRTRVAGRVEAQDNAPAANAIAASVQSTRRTMADVTEWETGGAGMMDGSVAPRDAGTEQGAFRAEGGSLYVVATPIGNLRDVTLRALDILRSVDIIAAEDTRVTAALLARYGVTTKPRALHRHNEAQQSQALLAALASGRSVALVSDAGTPGISDPGARVVRDARTAGHRVVPIPGATALAAAVSAAGLSAERFAFIGFLPQQAKARRELLATIAAWPVALVFY